MAGNKSGKVEIRKGESEGGRRPSPVAPSKPNQQPPGGGKKK